MRSAVPNLESSSVSSKLKVVLSAGNINHYHHAALALQQAGLLQRYLCTFSGQETEAVWGRMLTSDQRKRLQGKAIPELDISLIHTFPKPYMVTQALRRMQIINLAQADTLFSTWYDRLTISRAQEGDVFHFVSGLGLRAAEQAVKRNTKLICDVRTAHIQEEEDILRPEYETLGLDYRPTRTPGLRKSMLAEYDLADELFVMSTFARDTFLRQGFSPRRIHVLPLGVDVQRFAKQGQSVGNDRGRALRVIFVGQISPLKGLHYLIDAIRQANLSNCELLVLGSISDAEYARRYLPKCDTRIRFIGHVPQIELWRYYRMADVFVLPSVVDGFAMVVSEAMAVGLPIIVSENVGARDMVRNGIDGFIVPIRSADALTEKLVWLHEHPQERRAMGMQAAQQVLRFTWARYAERLLSAYGALEQREMVS